MAFLGHETVLKKELVSAILEENTKGREKVFLDLTFGGGGHSVYLLENLKEGKVLGLDQDQDAYENGLKKIDELNLSDRITLVKSNFIDACDVLERYKENSVNGVPIVAGIFADLGVSSHQFDAPERGFSFRFDGPLDMRMDKTNDLVETAADAVNSLDKEQLAQMFKDYGEEKLADRIAENIVQSRLRESIETTKQLEDIIFHSYPKKWRYGRTHPATKVFQALRIYVNKELDYLSQVIPRLISILDPGGRLAMISFHSLEDRIIKHSFKEQKHIGLGKIMTKKPIIASKEEIESNSRSRSAKLRVFEKA